MRRLSITLPDGEAAALLERWVPIAAALSLIVGNAIDAMARNLWVDELLSVTLVSDPSFTHMLHALADQVDTSPPLFYMVGWLWSRAVGSGALSLRLLAGACAAGAFLIVWRVVRPHASLAARCAGVCVPMLLPMVMLAQIAEARSYGLLLLCSAITLALVELLARGRATRWQIAAIALAQAALCATHVFGLAYSAAALAAVILADVVANRRLPLGACVAWCAGWLAFLVWLPALRHQAQVGVPYFPIARPSFVDLVHGLTLGTTFRVALLLPIALGIAVGVARRSVADDKLDPPRPARVHLLLVAAGWVLVAVAVWSVSRVSKPLFLPRYLVPLGLAYAVVLPPALDRMLHWANQLARRDEIVGTAGPPARSYLWVLGAITAVALYAPVWRADSLPRDAAPAGDSLDVHSELPIATISTHSYLPRVFYATRPSRYVFVLDWESAILPNAPVGPTEYKLMAAMKRNYPDHDIEESDEFLARHSRFYVLDEGGLFWFQRRIRNNAAYHVTLVHDRHLCGAGGPNELCGLYLVERISAAPATISLASPRP
jgi:hypothetical protein